jgi:hypothetical protein
MLKTRSFSSFSTPKMDRTIKITTSDFKNIRENNSAFVDKTEILSSLVRSDSDNFHFIVRPRRFGKSLMCSTINHLFSGSSHLFNGLWIKDEGKWDFEKEEFPVIHLDMSRCGAKTKENFDGKIFDLLTLQADKHVVELRSTSKTNDSYFLNLIDDVSIINNNINKKLL